MPLAAPSDDPYRLSFLPVSFSDSDFSLARCSFLLTPAPNGIDAAAAETFTSLLALAPSAEDPGIAARRSGDAGVFYVR